MKPEALISVCMLVCSNLFMTYAWYGHLKTLQGKAWWIAVLVSWAIAFFEYCFQVPANRIGFQVYSLPQLKILQEVITLVVFVGFAYFFMGTKLTINMFWAGLCLVGAVFFIFKDGAPL